ncbi:MAG: methyl-accepting chemotaxis protein [Treponema sp.]|jgi:methyl-accepting chemotaxis protein|nr:methyl-accepting chemotaxis protein [Treponema sp.]
MKIKLRLSLLVIVIMAVVVAGIAAILLRRASNISLDLNMRGLEFLSGQQAEFWKGREDGYIRALHTLADVMSDYETLPQEERRDRYDEMLKSALESEQNMISLYMVWKPNAIDGMDEDYIGRIGSSPTGQYAIAYTRETGKIVSCTSGDITGAMAHISGPNARKDRVENPAPQIVNGKETQTFIMSVPIISDSTNNVVGSVGCVLNVDLIQPILLNTIKTNDIINVAVMYSGDGTIMAHFIPERIGKKIYDVDMELGTCMEDVCAAIENGSVFRTTVYDPNLRENVGFVLKSFQIGNSDQHMAMLIGVSESYIFREVKAITRFTIILAVLALSLSAVIVYFAFNKVTNPIIKVAETLKDISEGEGDLTRTIMEHGDDEIADLARYFNKTLDKIRQLIVTIKGRTVTLSDIGGELAGNMTETAAAVNQIASNINSIKGRVISQSASVTQTNATMGNITVNIDKLNGHVEEQTSSMARSSSAIEEMLANIRSVTATLSKNADSVNDLAYASDAGRESLQNVATDIKEIEERSTELMKINAVIKNIASQTNLLSINAAIEAAHAGEAGMGFAVVADEIRKLAEDSGVQSKTVNTVLKKTKESIDKIIESVNNVLDKFEAIDEGVQTVSQQAENIRIAMEEQDQGSKQIMETFVHLNDITRHVKDGSTEMFEGSKEVIQESRSLEQVTHEITGGMNEMAIGADHINLAVNRVNEISGRNKENIDILVREVSRFKVA